MKLWAIVPELLVAAACLGLVPAAGLLRGRWRGANAWALLGVLVAAIPLTARMIPWGPVAAFEGTYVVDRVATSAKLLVEIGSLVTTILLVAHFRGREQLAQAPVALAFATLGAMLVTSASDLAVLLLFVEITSFASYLLVVQVRDEPRALEATVKYLLFGIFALGVMAYGLSFLYGLTGSLDFRQIGDAMGAADRGWAVLALLLVLVGFGFEIAAVPFHFWMPDALEGASAPAAGFISVVPKIAGFVALWRFLTLAMPGELAAWPGIVAGMAAVTMTFANLAALRQRSLKRLLAWSSVAQAGYVLIAVAPAGRISDAAPAMAYYLGAYLFMNLGAFAVAAQVERTTGSDSLDALRGLSRRDPLAAVALGAALLSLAGIPPLGGFAGKVFLLQSAFDGGMTWLGVVAAANWVVALFYYLRAVAPAFVEGGESIRGMRAGATAVVHAITIAGTLVTGVLPGSVLQLFR